MLALVMMVLSAAGDGGMRVILFVLVLVAVILIFAGCVIALVTLYNQRKAQ